MGEKKTIKKKQKSVKSWLNLKNNPVLSINNSNFSKVFKFPTIFKAPPMKKENPTKEFQQLLENNFSLARRYNRLTENLSDLSLKNFLSNKGSKITQFAFELNQEIDKHKRKPVFRETRQSVIPIREAKPSSEELWEQNLNTCIHFHEKQCRIYQKALSKTNRASFREILIRHKSFFQNSLPELRSLKLNVYDELEKATFSEKIK